LDGVIHIMAMVTAMTILITDTDITIRLTIIIRTTTIMLPTTVAEGIQTITEPVLVEDLAMLQQEVHIAVPNFHDA
jgi:hypothetical protein